MPGEQWVGQSAQQRVKDSQITSPIGAVIMYTSATTPKGWLSCDGSAIRRSSYSALFGIIGTTYGVGDGSTTFNLPDLASKFPYGSVTPGASGGAATHTHTVNVATKASDNIAVGGSSVGVGSHGHIGSTTNSPSNLPPYLALNFIIRVN